MNFFKLLHKLFKRKAEECQHVFDSAKVEDLNSDPPCKKCGVYLSKILQSGIYSFEREQPGSKERRLVRLN